ncbi:MAG TPA: hypothetical protein VFO31_17000, partial [Vicinamibacterales bacterium]|nr:hypothetical protein [Vicinamibacterales bacterium]
MRLAMGAVAVTCGLWLSGGTFRAAQADTDLTCRIPNPRPPAFFSPAPRTPGAVRTYSGTIGRRMVTMTLKITAGEASGSYVYNQIGQPIQLRGRLSGARLMLREFGDLREPSESTGSFDLSAPAPSDALRGSWHAPDGSRSTPVRLNRIAEDVEEPRVLLAWERRAPTDADWSWLADVDYSPVRGELVYLE